MIHLMIATPCYGGQMYIDYTNSLLELYHNLPKKYNNIAISRMFLSNDSLITRARNKCVANFLSKDCTHLLFIDADIGFDWKDVAKLIDHNKDIIGGIYPKKTLMWDKLNDPSLMEKYNSLKNITFGEFCKNSSIDYNLEFLEKGFEITNNTAKIKHLPTGFMMIKRNVFEKLIKIHPEKQYINYDNEAIIEKQKNSKYYDFFSVGIDPDTKNYLSEDWYFCNLCSKAGIDIYMDLSIQLNHTGTYKFQGDILASNTLSVTTKTQKK